MTHGKVEEVIILKTQATFDKDSDTAQVIRDKFN